MGNDRDAILIDEMENIRRKNNTNWMDIVRLAIKLDPVETKKLIAQIVENDRKIANVLEDLSK
jgi:hypothetical protein